MHSSFFQKTISSALLFFLFFSFTLRVPFLGLLPSGVSANQETFYSLVSIIVEDSIYPKVKSELERYATDVQRTLENTRVVILPAPKDASAFQIASLNEWLYFEWYNSLQQSDFESKLVWTVLVWDLPTPFVFDGNASNKTIIPYTDFIDKAYIYDHESGNYQKNDDADEDFSAEIWHWVIHPNSWDDTQDINLIKDYFDKNHDFYTWEWKFNTAKWILSGNTDDELNDDYKPFVFYYDQFRETSAIQYQKYEWYKAYLENIEDLTYNRYSKDLAAAVKDQVLEWSSDDMRELISNLDPNFPLDGFNTGPDITDVPDVQTRHITDASVKKFLEIFNGSALWEMRKLVHNAGRYNEGGREVNVDMIPFLISALDEVNAQIVKNVSYELEKEIDTIVENGLSRNIAIPLDIQATGAGSCGVTHTNFLYGKQASLITNASECTIYRGSNSFSWTLVEANRWLNINNSQLDMEKNQALRTLQQTAWFKTKDLCNGASTSGYWWGNSPLNLNTSGEWYFALASHDLKGGIESIFDIAWWTQIDDNSKVASPLDCFNNNYITTFRQSLERDGLGYSCETDLSIPIGSNPVVWWSCDSINQKYSFSDSFDDLFLWARENICNGKTLILDGASVACDGLVNAGASRYAYKKISSHVKHISPTSEEYAAQLTNMVSPSLPIDKKRYVDFVSADGSYQKLDYPNLFALEDAEENNFETASENLKSELDRISLQINTIRKDHNPSALSGNARSLYNLMKTWEFPSKDVDLYKDFQEKDLSVYSVNWDSKEISYYDTLVFSLYWNKLNTPSAKYKFIFENYLSDQFASEDNFNLPKSKKSYEIAYLWAPGDHENMYIKLDPEGKSDNEYASVISDNIKLDSQILGSNIGNNFSLDLWDVPSGDLDAKTRFGESAFQCAPPDGVPIWEWIPAITCWMNDMLPPSIGISDGHCWATLLSDQELEEYHSCNGDVNKNGVSDCIEWKLTDWELSLSSDSQGYSYNSNGSLTVDLLDSSGKRVSLDNASYVKFELVKVDIPLDSNTEFSSTNTQTIFDSSIPTLATDQAREEAAEYINFKDSEIRVRSWSAKANFSSKWRDANISFRTTLSTNDHTGNQIISLESFIREVQIRWDMFFASTHRWSTADAELQIAENSVVASANPNIYLIDANQQDINDISSQIANDSGSKEKLIFSLSNISKSGNTLPLYYPIDIKIIQDDELIFEQTDVIAWDISSFTSLSSIQKSGTYDFIVTNARWMSSNKTFEVLPDIATALDVNLSTTVSEVGWSPTTHVFSILDQYSNPATGSLYNVKGSIFGKWIEFTPNNSQKIDLNTFEWYSAFRLKSTNTPGVNKITFDLYDGDDRKITSTTETIQILEGIQLDVVSEQENISVGWGVYDFELTLRDANNNVINDFNSRAYLAINPLYGKSINPYVDIKNGKGNVSLQTATLAGRDVKLEFQIEWLNGIYKQDIDILPGKPIKVDMALSKGKIEASTDDSSLLEVALKDRYDNLVFNDNTTQFDIELLEKYSEIVSFDIDQKTSVGWKNQFKISGTDIPGIARFKISTTPSIESNSFSLVWQSPFAKSKLDIFSSLRRNDILTDDGRILFREYSDTEYISQFSDKQSLLSNEIYTWLSQAQKDAIVLLWDETNTLEIVWVWENAGSIETFYFWDNESVFGNNYNAHYSVLLGAPYGDITKENYLASGLLFDKDNAALWVTSLLNDPYKRDDILSIHPSGSLSSLSSGADITQDIDFYFDVDESGMLTADISNAALSSYIWKLYYNLDDNTAVSVCERSELENCLDKQESQILSILEDESYILEEKSGWIILKNAFGREVFSIDNNARFDRKSNVYIEPNYSNKSNYLSLHLLSEDKIIAEIIVDMQQANINISRWSDTLLRNKLTNLKNTLILSLQTNLYWSRDLHISSDLTKKVLFYNDPFASRGNLDSFHEGDQESFSGFWDTAGAGWEQWNKTLLEVAAGKTVWEATRDYASFSLINLWDPVFALRKIQKTFQTDDIKKHFDASIWKRISGDEEVEWYRVFDYNADDRDDLLLVESDGYLKLLENKYIHGSLLEKWPLVFAADIWGEALMKTGDFTGDWYDDIFFVNDKWNPYLFNNHLKDFVRLPLEEIFDLKGKIVQVETYDMDNDTNHDIVTLDDSGEIHIFYGWGSDASPNFTKLKVWDGYGIELNSDILSWWAAIYFDGVPQIEDDRNREDLIASNEQYFAQLGENLALRPESAGIDRGLLDRLIFTQVPYSPYVDSDLNPQDEFIASLDNSLPNTGNPSDDDYVQATQGALTDFVSSNSWYIDYSEYSNVSRNSNTTFIRSEYSETLWVKVEKSFTDINEGLLQTWDIIQAEIILTNTSTSTIDDLAYIDDLPESFTMHSDEIEVVNNNQAVVNWPWSFDILLDDISLSPGQSITLKYEVKTPPIRFGFLQVWDYELWKVGEDEFGDILLKDSEKNCWEEATLYTSDSQRAYTKAGIVPHCDTDKLELPWNLSENAIDENNNGVPDYIDTLGAGSSETVQNYMQWLLEEFNQDSDNDGIPDRDDSAPNIDENDGDFMSSLLDFNENIDEITGEIDHIIEWFGCWFGWGWCIATPLNWAPLAPWSDPVLFGKPIGDGLRVDEGLPIFSSLTWFQIPATPTSPPVCVPSVWPVSKAGYVPGPTCWPESAWWKLGTWAPTNTVRIFATPTLTGWFGIAVCFGWPAITAGYSNPPGISPIAPGGNCIVAAVPIIACWEEDNGDPASLGYPSHVPGALWSTSWGWASSENSDGSFSVINGNCEPGASHASTTAQTLDAGAVQWYVNYRNGNTPYSTELEERLVQALSTVARDGWNYSFSGWPIMDFAWGWEGNTNVDVAFDLSSAAAWDFSDVVKVELDRVSPFPNFLMDWVTRQMEEVVNKLTDLPKIFVILPDMSGIFEYGWSDFNKNLKESFEEEKEERSEMNTAYTQQINRLENQKKWLDCVDKNSLQCKSINRDISRLEWARSVWQGEAISGIRSVYEFLWNVPLVAIEPETIEVNIPWMTPEDIEATKANWQNTLDEWKAEVDRAWESWSLWETCNYIDPNQQDPNEKKFQQELQAECQQDNALKNKAYVDANNLISSLERNISILEDYKRFPEKLNKLITIKQTRLEQIVCNVDAISGMLGGWISFNGERFKAWVELYVLIKAILKSWQLVIDVFVDYEAECHECKNERQDLIGWTFQLISAVIPKPPIIQFPKWPDIIMDLHNIRAGLVVYLPDFSLNQRPIVLPTLPALRLPDTPNGSLSIPALPILPSFTIPELPELPTLPAVELPNLPPPPKIPKLFGAVEWVLNILKLVTKAMCILKTSPFVPEWRAWDQIAYITERSWYLPTDFIDLSFPQFSYPFIDAIKVTSYVNLEFETEFLTEAVRNIAAPLDTFTNDIVNMFQINIANIDLEVLTPSDIDVNINGDGTIDTEGLRIQPGLESMNTLEQFLYSFVMVSADRFADMLTYVEENKHITLTNKEFLSYVSENLASTSITSDPRTQDLRNLWNQVGNMTYSKEDALIEKLQQTKNAKFNTLTDILNTEKLRNDELKEQIKDLWSSSYITQVALNKKTNLEAYNQSLNAHNLWLMESAVNLVNGWWDQEVSTIQQDGEDLLERVNGWIVAFEESIVAPHLNLLADNHTGSSGVNSCSAHGSNGYSYTYEWIYILQDNHNYKLFAYTDELSWDEKTSPIDIDNDGDNDLLYMVDGQVYFKENLSRSSNTTHVNSPALYISVNDNKFLNGDRFLESINGFNEINVSNGFINAEFMTPTSETDNFAIEFFDRVDASLEQDNSNYVPEGIKKYTIDAFADIEWNTLKARRDNIIMRQNLAHIKYAGKLPGVKLTTAELVNIKDNLENNVAVNLTPTTKLYAGNTPFMVKYTVGSSDEILEVKVTKNSHIVFGDRVQVVGITGNAYVATGKTETIEGPRILTHIGKPLFPWTKIEITDDIENLTESSHIDIVYYDGSERDIYFRESYGYEIYDLWDRVSDTHVVRIEQPNDFYYATISSFDQSIAWTHSQQILFSPQLQADKNAPDISLSKPIRVPVYQTKTIDMTEYVYEDGGVKNIADIWVDFDLTFDSDEDGNTLNDRDIDKIEIEKTLNTLDISFGPYEELFTKNIRISVEDKNGNIGQRNVGFEVYAPQPQIDSILDGTIAWSLDEQLIWEPIRIYRYRWGAVEKLQEISWDDKILSILEWNYDFETPQTSSWLVLTRDGNEVANINEYTGHINLIDPLTTVEIVPSNADENDIWLPRLAVVYRWTEIFHEYIQVLETADIPILSEFTSDLSNGLYLRFIDSESYGYYKLPLGVPYNPWAVVIHRIEDNAKTPLFTLFRDGRIDVLDERFTLNYASYQDSVVIELYDSTIDKKVWEMLLKVNANYILR